MNATLVGVHEITHHENLWRTQLFASDLSWKFKKQKNYWNTIPYVHFAQNFISYVHFAQNSISHAHFAQNSISHVHFARNSIFHKIEFFSCSLHKIKKRTRPASSITLKILESKKKKTCNFLWHHNYTTLFPFFIKHSILKS